MKIIISYLPIMLKGLSVTLELLLVGGGLSLVFGLMLAIFKIYGPKPVQLLVSGYIELMRGLPPILQLFIIYFGLEQVQLYLSSYMAAIVWLVLLGSGYSAEVFRAGILGVAKGQSEAAEAVGMRPWTILHKVILPQALGAMLPPLTNFVVVQLKNTTLVYFIGVHDIMYQARLGVGATSQPAPLYALAAGIYVAITIAITRLGRLFERRVEAYR